MSTGLPSRHALPDYLPGDALAQELEARGLWRRAATRWQQLLLQATDHRQAEAIVQRQRYCLRQVAKASVPGDGTGPAGGGVSVAGSTSGPDLWRTA